MITGAHSIIYSRNAAADRAFLRDVLGLPHVDAGDGWLIFALPPSEVGVHPAGRNGAHELYLMTGDIERFIAAMKRRRVACTPVREMPWGLLTQVKLPGGGALGVYEALHERPNEKAEAVPRRSRRSRGQANRRRPAGRQR